MPRNAPTFREVLNARLEGRAAVNEKSLGRAFHHAAAAGHDSFAIVTSWRGDKSGKENKSNFDSLKKDIRAAGHGHFKLKGHWQECPDVGPDEYKKIMGDCPNGWNSEDGRCAKKDMSAKNKFSLPYDKCPVGQKKDAVEPSLFVPGMKLDHAVKLAKKYNQDAIVYSGPETKGETHLVFQDGSTKPVGKFHAGRIAQAYSQIKGGSFTFEGWELVAQDRLEELVERSWAKEHRLWSLTAALREFISCGC